MANYISSNANRFYAALESTYGQAAPITPANRLAANKLSGHQSVELVKRHNKTGTRTYLGQSSLARRRTTYEVRSYLALWDGLNPPSQGPLFQAALGGTPTTFTGGTILASINPLQLQTQAPHGLTTGSGVSLAGEIRFVTAVLNETTFVINAPFTRTPQMNDLIAPAITYRLGSTLSSLTLYDYWDPNSAVSRMLVGGAVNHLELRVNGDYHEFLFTGPAADLLDSTTPLSGSAGITSFPIEPPVGNFDSSGVPGHLGQAWFGAPSAQCFTLTDARIAVQNGLELRNREFGATLPRAVVPGPRQVSTSFSLLAQDDQQTKALYSFAKQRQPLPLMLQLGVQQGRLMGVYLPAVIPEIPEFDDGEVRLQWKFNDSLAQGSFDDELVIAFG